jgi:hypothetical protein
MAQMESMISDAIGHGIEVPAVRVDSAGVVVLASMLLENE